MMTERECLTWILGFTYKKLSLDDNDLDEMSDYIHATLNNRETWQINKLKETEKNK